MKFNELFPSFKLAIPETYCTDCGKSTYCQQSIEDNCLDKQRVIEAIQILKHSKKIISSNENLIYWNQALCMLEKELGLER